MTNQIDQFYEDYDKRRKEPRKTLEEWEREFNGGRVAPAGSQLLTEEAAHGALQRRNLVRLRDRKKREPPKTIVIVPNPPSSIRVRP